MICMNTLSNAGLLMLLPHCKICASHDIAQKIMNCCNQQNLINKLTTHQFSEFITLRSPGHLRGRQSQPQHMFVVSFLLRMLLMTTLLLLKDFAARGGADNKTTYQLRSLYLGYMAVVCLFSILLLLLFLSLFCIVGARLVHH